MGQISRETVERIIDENDIVEVIGSYFPLKRAGARYVALCPFHTERTPSFGVNPQRQIFHCFGCGAGGDVIRFVMQYENLPFPDAAKKLAERAGIHLLEEAFDPKEEASRKMRRELQAINRKAAEWYHRLLLRSPEAHAAREYLKGRGFGIEVAKRWMFGYAPESPAPLIDWAKSEGFHIRHLVEGGLAQWREEGRPDRGAYARFRHRLMFPVANDFGEVIAFSGRVLSKDQPGGKYVNSPETVLFNKSKTFFGLDKSKRAITRDNRAVVVEGQLDMISAFEAGIENIVAPLGTAFTEQHARLLKRHTGDSGEVVLCYDSDTAGYNAVVKAFRQLAAVGVLVRVAQLPAGEDPDSLIRSRGADALKTILLGAPEFFDFQIDHHGGTRNLNDLRERLAFARELSENIALIEDKMLQDSLIARVTTRLGVGETDIRKLVADVKRAAERTARSVSKREAIESRREAESAPAGDARPGNPMQQGAIVDLTLSNRSVRMLCQLLLSDAAARRQLTAQEPPEFLKDLPETEFLTRLWRADFDPGSTASVSGYTATLSPAEQDAVAGLMSQPMPADAGQYAEECLRALQRQATQNRIRGLKARLNDPRLEPAQLEALTKELLDLTLRLNDIPPLAP
jgi:DNA primase